MGENIMVLPAANFDAIRVLRVPHDMEEHEAFRYVTGIIGEVEEENPGYDWEEIAERLEEYGFAPVEFILGPVVD